MELLDGLTESTGIKLERAEISSFPLEYLTPTRKAYFEAKTCLSVKDFHPKEAGAAFDRIRLKIMRDEITPDEGTLKDIEWLMKFVEFGEFVQQALPDWHRCDKCGKVRLCIANVMDLSFKCFECNFVDTLMSYVNKGITDPIYVQDFLNTGNMDPSKHWRTYESLIKEQLNRFARRSELEEEFMKGPYIPLQRMNNLM